MVKLKQVLTGEELSILTARSDWRAAWLVLFNWGLIALALAMVAIWPHWLTILVATVLIGGRQLGLGIIMHECGHNTLFKTRSLNRFVGRWLAGYPLFSDLDTYAQGHLMHHRLAGTAGDPDLANYQAYPVTKASLRRKLFRDITGQTGLRFWAAVWSNHPNSPSRSIRGDGGNVLWQSVLCQLLLLLIMTLLGHPWLYAIWLLSMTTTYFLFLRIRQIGEHGAVPDLNSLDPRDNTRTTYARWWERLLVCPNYVNYHLEHHILPSVPAYRLAGLHRLLRRRGIYDGVVFPKGYLTMLKQVVI